MAKRIYVGNLAYSVTEDSLRELFAEYGEVASVNVVKDKFTQQSRGFGFVEMPDDSEAQAAITAVNGKELDGRALNVNEARPRGEGGRGGGFGGGRGGGRPGGRSGGRQGGRGRDRRPDYGSQKRW